MRGWIGASEGMREVAGVEREPVKMRLWVAGSRGAVEEERRLREVRVEGT